MSGFLNVIKKNLGLGGSKQAGETTESTATAKPAKKSKGSAYFLELDDAKGVGTGNATTPAKAEVAAKAAEPSTNGNKPEAKKADVKAKPEAKVAAPAPAPVAKPAAPAAKQTTTFAPDYLISPNSYSGRRRPGANMNYFLDLARQAKTPNK